MKTTTFEASSFAGEARPSLLGRCANAVAQFGLMLRQSAADRIMRAELAKMDDSMLLDIGVARDEIPLVRAGRRFTPQAWVERGY